MRATCPNDCDRKEFFTPVVISQEWLVTENGEWVEDGDSEVVLSPDACNKWECAECGATAIVD